MSEVTVCGQRLEKIKRNQNYMEDFLTPFLTTVKQ